MTRNEQLKVLKSQNATKEQLRSALAASLGVEYQTPGKEKKETLLDRIKLH